MAEDPGLCFLCDKSIINDATARQITGDALKSVISASKQRQDQRHLIIRKHTTITVHATCGKNYTHRAKIEAYLRRQQKEKQKAEPERVSRSTHTVLFNFSELCLYCGKSASDDYIESQKKLPIENRTSVRKVTKNDLKDSIVERCGVMKNKLSVEVLARVERVNDLIEVGARYHHPCQVSFHHSTEKDSSVELTNTSQAAQFIATYLEQHKDECQFSIKTILEEFPGDKNVDIKYLRPHLENIFDKDILIHPSRDGHIITYVNAGAKILTESWYKKKANVDSDTERENICKLAGKIILEDIRKRVYDTETYPAPANFVDQVNDDVPHSLQVILEEIIVKNKAKPKELEPLILTLSHIIISATRPRSFLSPILIGLGAMLDKLYGSRELVQTLHAAGLCASYDEIRLFQASLLANSESTENKEMYKDAYIQMVFDNADHDVRTIDGRNTFHVEGGIEILTPGNVVAAADRIPKLSKIPKSSVQGQFGKVVLHRFSDKANVKNIMKTVNVVDLNNYRQVQHTVQIRATDFLWLLGKVKFPKDFKGWNGFMETITEKEHYKTSKVRFLPFINNPPSDYDTLYTALRIADDKRKLLGQDKIFVTFDEPQFRKARHVLQACWEKGELLSVRTRLGGLHSLFSFIKATEFVMDGSGLREAACQIYAENSVDKIISGVAYGRSIRMHTLTHLALGQKINSLVDFTEDEDKFLNKILSDLGNALEMSKHKDFEKIHHKFLNHVETLKKRGPTAKLWVIYYDMITLVKQFIEAERSGNWQLHLETMTKMLPFYHATGHFRYAESAQIYLQDMYDLTETMTETEYAQFVTEGYFTIRRSDKFYCGISSDMAIEQILMRCLKTRGGLTRGRGVSDAVLARWILNMPSLAALTEVIQAFYNISFASSEQHIDARPSRIERDFIDLNKLIQFFEQYDPFPVSDKIMCITSGVEGNDKVNVHNSDQIGINLMTDIVGNTFGNLKFKRTNRVVSLQSSSTVKVNGKDIVVNPNAIFQRIVMSMENNPDLPDYFKYELSSFPPSIFENGYLRKTDKSKLYEAFKTLDEKPDNYVTVIDGGLLMHKVVWLKNTTYNEIMSQYVKFVKRYGDNCYVIFDGYPNEKDKCTKIVERDRRQSQHSTTIKFELQMQATVPQEKFFSNENNKKRFIEKLRLKLEEAGHKTKQAFEDADTLIVKTAIEVASDVVPAVIVAEDVDIIVILSILNHSSETKVYLLKPSKGEVPEKWYDCHSFQHQDLKYLLGFIHAFSGCDTTSAFFNQGKKKIIAMLHDEEKLRDQALVFNNPESTKEEIEKAGLPIISAMYSKQLQKLSLDVLRYRLFKKKKKPVLLHSLPPTEAAAIQHLHRVFHQVQQWFGNELNPTDWGWTVKEGKLQPVYGPTEVVPKNLLKEISCKCKSGCNKRCTCVKHGLKCSDQCGSCHGQTCNNIDTVEDIDVRDLDEDLDDIDENDIEAPFNEDDDDGNESEVNVGSYDSDDEGEDNEAGNDNQMRATEDSDDQCDNQMRVNDDSDDSDVGLLEPKRAKRDE